MQPPWGHSHAAASEQAALGEAFGAFGQYQMYRAINIAVHTHINEMGILVHEVAPDTDSLQLASAKNTADDDAAEEAAATLVTVDSEFGRTTDPVRMYMREMGTVELLTREGEIVIAKRIEDGLGQVLHALAAFPESTATLLRGYERVEAGDMRLNDLITGFVDPNADDEPATPAPPAAVPRPVPADRSPLPRRCHPVCVVLAWRRTLTQDHTPFQKLNLFYAIF